jgi:hypothetical protein
MNKNNQQPFLTPAANRETPATGFPAPGGHFDVFMPAPVHHSSVMASYLLTNLPVQAFFIKL